MFPHQRRLFVLLGGASGRATRNLQCRTLTATTSGINEYTRRVLQLALDSEIQVHGWTQEAVVAAAEQMSGSIHNSNNNNISLAAVGMVQDPTQLLYFAMEQWNEQLRHDLAERPQAQEENEAEFIYQALKLRLGYMGKLVQAKRWHEGMALGARPDNWLETEKHVRGIIEVIAEARPTLSTSEQLGLGAVYVAAELHMLADSSIDFVDTWTFLKSRVDDWDRLRSSSPLSSDQLYVVSSVASSVASGVASLLISPRAITDLQQLAMLTTAKAHSTVQQASGLASQILSNAAPNSQSAVPGSSPNDYNVSSSSKFKN